jgi:hypothetical protein
VESFARGYTRSSGYYTVMASSPPNQILVTRAKKRLHTEYPSYLSILLPSRSLEFQGGHCSDCSPHRLQKPIVTYPTRVEKEGTRATERRDGCASKRFAWDMDDGDKMTNALVKLICQRPAHVTTIGGSRWSALSNHTGTMGHPGHSDSTTVVFPHQV